jgi:hypothetical protein
MLLKGLPMTRRSILAVMWLCAITLTSRVSAQVLPRPDKARADLVAKAKPYIESGMPSPDRPWMSSDYQQGLKVMAKIKKDKSLPLPRFHDDPSGGLFARMINAENLGLMEDENLPLATRMGEASAMMGTIGPLMIQYYSPENKEQPYGDELLEIMAFSLRVYQPLIKLSGQFWESLPEEEKANPVRIRGLERMRKAMATSVLGALTIVGETDQYSRDKLRAFAGRLPGLFPPIWSSLDPSSRAEFQIKIGDLAQSHPDKDVRLSMTIVAEVLSSEGKKPTADPVAPTPPKAKADSPR